MSNYTDKEELEFVESLYNEADRQIKEVYQEQKNNRDELLKQIAAIMITYTILNDLMKLSKTDKKKEYNRLSKMITSGAQSQGTTQNRVIKDILTTAANKTFNFYSYNVGLKDVKEIIGNNFKGKHFSTRVWKNESDVAKHLHKQVNDFLNGKVNVNQIKKNIKTTYNTSAYNARRLVETEINRVEDESFKKFCRETNVKRVMRNEEMDSRTCSECAGINENIYDLADAPSGLHPLCRGFNTIVE
ncbi:minor capsid protein [Clostridium estertheticum]|uniref:minor capsid protein n=1 Tax=Clostridium estertheticum TaxID=238834 RepID=UPI001CF21314|nr:minor capsid protein [Clostridium estertheticum]MCB2308833.1 minor capsid protein [Clostridium estertheticum]MCB2347321.1 minor capsid protein [Clostridium estertheticum]MCB2351913.1 minor capsid protein [Clostridium estertheticum]WAG48520.1 minor capsid protein [Clostridium estertheticum]